MRWTASLLLLLWLAAFGLAAKTPASAKKPAKSSTKSVSVKKPAPVKPRTSAKSSPQGGKKKVLWKRRSPSWRYGHQAPTPERYREIQQALIDRGYLSSPATGEWGEGSAEALRRFQQDQHLEPTGKLNSLSLIALGLGPKRNPVAQNGRAGPTESKVQP